MKQLRRTGLRTGRPACDYNTQLTNAEVRRWWWWWRMFALNLDLRITACLQPFLFSSMVLPPARGKRSNVVQAQGGFAPKDAMW